MSSGCSGDETYLEAFIESLTTLPNQMKRNLELIKNLDSSCQIGSKQLQQLYQQYIQQAEEKMMKLEIVEDYTRGNTKASSSSSNKKRKRTNPDDDDNDNDDSEQQHQLPRVGVRVLGGGDEIIIPTTQELMSYTFDAELYEKIRALQQECLQKSDEKVATAIQTYDMVDSVVRRLDRDLECMETILQSSGELYGSGGIGIGAGIGAGGTGTGTTGGGGISVGTAGGTGSSMLLKNTSAAASRSTSVGVGGASASSAAGSAMMSNTNTNTNTNRLLPKPNDLAACQVTVGVSEWILAKVLQHDINAGMYKLIDEDVESSNKVFTLPESQVILSGVDKLSRGDTVFAVYPDTTSFYQATVVQAPRKNTGGGGHGAFVLVNFVDDSDEFGITHDKAVPTKHVMHPPYNATIQ